MVTISQYFERIKDFYISKGMEEDYDLKSSIESNILNSNEKYFNLLHLFEEYPKEENHEIINKIVSTLGLLFINQKETEGNICFANSQDLRPEFKQSFTLMDVLDYSCAILHSKVYHRSIKDKDFIKIPFPSDAALFWELVQSGSDWRNK
ncbi:hypothetical protein D3C87_1516750 [compost metagenome]